MAPIQPPAAIFQRLYMNKFPAPASRAGLCSFSFPGALLMLGLAPGLVEGQHVKLIATPDGGIQPQAAVDAKGVVHLVYFKGEPRAGDIFYVRRGPGEETFSKPIQVNSQPHTAMAMGTIRGAQLAVGKNGRVHVAWDGMGEGAPIAPHQAYNHAPSAHPDP